jgi:hypothetical protein
MVEPQAAPPDLAQRDEMWRRVGRNLLQFQKIEGARKQLLLAALVQTPVGQGPRVDARASVVLRMSMGEALKAVLAEVVTPQPTDTPRAVNSAASIVTRFILTPADAADLDALRTRWLAAVQERNQLVHHQLDRLTSTSATDFSLVLDELDAQHAQAVVVLEEVCAILTQLVAHRQALAAQLSAPEGQSALLAQLAEARAVEILWRTAESHTRKDGWTLLQTAQQGLSGLRKDEVELLIQRDGVRWLDALLAAPDGLFDCADEPWPNHPGQARRRLYRIKQSVLNQA